MGGKIIYDSKDKSFEKYLNAKKRGVNQYKQYDIMKYQNLLFGNCIIQKDIFKEIKLNLKLKSYGGEELDFAYRLNQQYSQQIIACNSAVAYRINHPSLMQHILRIEEFGKYNFCLLNNELQNLIVRNNVFIIKHVLIQKTTFIISLITTSLYRLGLRNSIIIKIILLASLLKGYHQKIR